MHLELTHSQVTLQTILAHQSMSFLPAVKVDIELVNGVLECHDFVSLVLDLLNELLFAKLRFQNRLLVQLDEIL